MKKWQMGLGVLVVAVVALSVIFTNLNKKQAEPGTGGGAAAPAQTTGANQPKAGAPALAQPGSAAPEFELKDMQGNTVKLSDFRGKKVVVNFWASWCGPCKMEMPDLVKKSEQYKDKIMFLGVNLTQSEADEEGPKKFISQFNVKYPNLLDPDGHTAQTYKVLAIPTTYTIDQNGIVVDRHQGMMTEAQMEMYIQKLLQK